MISLLEQISMKREENMFEMYGNKLLSILSLLFLLCFVGEIPIATIPVRERDTFPKVLRYLNYMGPSRFANNFHGLFP